MRHKKKHQKKKIRKILNGLFSAKDEGVKAYFDTALNAPEEFDVAGFLVEGGRDNPITDGEAEDLLFECLRELCPPDHTDDMIMARVKEFIDNGFVERWNSGAYW